MSCVRNPEYDAYRAEIVRHHLSETISDVDSRFAEELRLNAKSAERSIVHPKNTFSSARGSVIKYETATGQELFIYLGVNYIHNGISLSPRSFYFGTDIVGGKLEVFLLRIQGELQYSQRKNVLGLSQVELNGHTVNRQLLLSCVESHKKRTKEMYRDIVRLPLLSPISDLKRILDS